MSIVTVRVIVTMLLAILLARQAREAAPGSRRRAAFTLGAAGLALLGMMNAASATLSGLPWLLWGGTALALVLMGLAVLRLLQAVRAGELNDQMRRARELIAESRAEREDRNRRDDR